MYDAPDLQKTEHGEGVKDQGVADGALILQCRTLHTRYCEVWRGGSNAWRSVLVPISLVLTRCGRSVGEYHRPSYPSSMRDALRIISELVEPGPGGVILNTCHARCRMFKLWFRPCYHSNLVRPI
ncbi:hypothetical protein BDR07DRAFT_1393228 [Suillus spraguei]|nr:hypothetical protein BDR07DRAFT_1393228 [Suillus spraguei]